MPHASYLLYIDSIYIYFTLTKIETYTIMFMYLIKQINKGCNYRKTGKEVLLASCLTDAY